MVTLSKTLNDIIKFYVTSTDEYYNYSQSNPAFPPMSICIDKLNRFIEMKMAVAGFKKENISVTSENEYLTISGTLEKDESSDLNDVVWIKNNLKIDSFSRTWEFPDDKFDFRNPKVVLKDGILTVRIEKNPNLVSKKKEIVIE